MRVARPYRGWARGESSKRTRGVPASPSVSPRIPSGIPSPRICSKAGRTCARCRKCSAMPISPHRSSTRTSTGITSAPSIRATSRAPEERRNPERVFDGMRWTPGPRSEDLEDRRGQGFGGLGVGRLGVGGVVVLLVLSLIFKRDFFSLISGGQAAPAGAVASTPEEEHLVDFVSFVFDTTQSTWRAILAQRAGGVRYQDAKLVLFRDGVQSACGIAQSATGPFYCPSDHKVYIDLGFYDEPRIRPRRELPDLATSGSSRAIPTQKRRDRGGFGIAQSEIRHLLRIRILHLLNRVFTGQMAAAEGRAHHDRLIGRSVGQIAVLMARVAALGDKEHLAPVNGG